MECFIQFLTIILFSFLKLSELLTAQPFYVVSYTVYHRDNEFTQCILAVSVFLPDVCPSGWCSQELVWQDSHQCVVDDMPRSR